VKPEPSNRDDRRPPPASLLLVVLCGALMVAGCASETKYRWLSRFFDGVPAPGSTNAPPPLDPDYHPLPGNTNAVMAVAAKPLVSPTLHPPFHDGKCTECHESKFSQKMKGPINTVCFSCHDDFLEHAKVKHQPAEGGDCLSCHDPHESPNKKLLTRVGAAMCLECHEAADIEKVAAHKTPNRDNCVTCHDPHGSANSKLLKTAAVKIPAGTLPDSPPATPAK
jgi:predicted CXXCH cytochrome family protein